MTKQTAPTSQNSGPDKKKRLKNAAYIVLIILLLALAVGGVYAKYIYSNAATGTVLAREFYFTSDHLRADGVSYTLNPGTTGVTFELRNHADSLRYSSDDIAYTVTIKEKATDNTVFSMNGIICVETPDGTAANKTKDTATISVTGLQGGKTYVVTATGTGGYKVGDDYKTDGKGGYSETLSATFTVLAAGEGVYMHWDTTNSAYVLLTVWTENVIGDAFISFPDGLIPDTTDPVLDDVANYSGGTYVKGSFVDEQSKADEGSFTKPYSSRTYRFFKSGYTSGNFDVKLKVDEQRTIPAQPSTP